MKVEQAKMNLLQKARARPDQVKKVIDTAKTLGWKSAIEKVKNRLESPTPLGYSAAGEVVEVHPANTRFRLGDRVAVGGAECAFHAEYIGVPDLLSVRVPDSVENWEAAYTTLCAISMQAVRQAGTSVGDKVVVVGQGLVGLLATGILRAAGASVLAVDVDESRLAVAKSMGAERTVNPKGGRLEDSVMEWTSGHGADQYLLCIGGKDPKPAETAFHCLRDRGVLVIVGIYDAVLSWKQFYAKEIEVKYSRSYGPGRYDPSYEWAGNDYPIGYVRWTEQRNFEACLQLMADKRIDLDRVTTGRYPFSEALKVYDELSNSNEQIGLVLEYGDSGTQQEATPTEAPSNSAEAVTCSKYASAAQPVARIDVVGAGNFAKTMLLPSLSGRIPFGAIVNQTSLSANHVKSKFSFENALTSADELFDGSRKAGRAVVIGTRHHLHAPHVVAGLRQNYHVFVEKPLCLTREELGEIDLVEKDSTGTVMVGFNRRFAPATDRVKQVLKDVPGPKTVAFHVFPGQLAPDHWYANYEESGGRVLGEACHFFDFFCYLLNSDPVRVCAQTTWSPEGRLPFPDSITAQVEFSDGSCGQLIYSAGGDHAYPKEEFKVYGSGVVIRCENFQKLQVYRGRREEVSKFGSKGHAEEMAAWADFLSARRAHPLPYAQARTSMLLTFSALDSIREARSIEVR